MSAAITDYLQANGEKMEAEIAKALQLTMTQVHDHLQQLSIKGEVICCKVTKFQDGKRSKAPATGCPAREAASRWQAFTAHKTR
jgi:predicted ArsR family transcriptional regulator